MSRIDTHKGMIAWFARNSSSMRHDYRNGYSDNNGYRSARNRNGYSDNDGYRDARKRANQRIARARSVEHTRACQPFG